MDVEQNRRADAQGSEWATLHSDKPPPPHAGLLFPSSLSSHTSEPHELVSLPTSSTCEFRPRRRQKISAEVRKARHRGRMQRQRLADKLSIEMKRQQVRVLSKELTYVITRHLTPTTRSHYEEENDDKFQLFHSPPSLQRQYINLVMQQDKIQKENSCLRGYLLDWDKFNKLVEGEHERMMGEAARIEGISTHTNSLNSGKDETKLAVTIGSGNSAQHGYWIAFTEDEPFLYYEIITRSVCQAYVYSAYQQMQHLERGLGSAASYPPTDLLGWKVVYTCMHRQVKSNRTPIYESHHRFFKRINNSSRLPGTANTITIDHLANMVWQIINSSELYAKMYHSKMVSRVLQHVDDHTCILVRTYPDQDLNMNSRFVCFVSRLEDQVEDPFSDYGPRRRAMLLLSAMDPAKCFRSTGSDAKPVSYDCWIKEGMGSFNFIELPGGDIEIEYVGYQPIGSEAYLGTVIRNITEVLIRMEHFITPPSLSSRLLPPPMQQFDDTT